MAQESFATSVPGCSSMPPGLGEGAWEPEPGRPEQHLGPVVTDPAQEGQQLGHFLLADGVSEAES